MALLTVEEGIKYLHDAGAKVTLQRIAIMKALEDRQDHPTAESLFLELKPDYPTLSIATVYSTTHLLAQASLIRILSIDEKKVYYDSVTEPHAHFMCNRCKRIIDIDIDLDSLMKLPNDRIASVENTEVFYYGLCRECEAGT